ncbi:MAG: hypothetical protein HY898_30980 [Deltaproteobacteria bacterium]|nr:hypothetical protein [Deltaproteobacteria bacterium]
MRRNHALGIILAAPASLASLEARATDPADPYRPRDPDQESSYEDAIELERGPGHGRAWVSLGSFYKRTVTGRSDLGVMLMLGWPLESTARVRPGRVRVQGAVAEPTAPAPAAQTAPAPETASLRVTSKVARSCVQAAWRAHGWAADQDLDRMGNRARWSAALPEVRLRAARGWDESFRLTPTDSDPYRSQETSGASRWLEGRLIWRLDRVMFSDEEIPIERLRMQRADARSRVAGKVLSALFDWQKATLAVADPLLSSQEHINALLAQAEAEAVLDVLTAGWFSRWLETRSSP